MVKVVGVKVRGTVVLVMVVETELLLLATSAIRVQITGHRSEITRLTVNSSLECRLQLRNHLSGFLELYLVLYLPRYLTRKH